MQKRNYQQRKRLPIHIQVASLFGIHIPASLRFKDGDAIEFVQKELEPIQYSFREFCSNSKERRMLSSMKIFRQHQMIVGFTQVDELNHVAFRNSFMFFLPAPFDSRKCVNDTTTLLQKVDELVGPLSCNVSQMLHQKGRARSCYMKRQAVAHGNKTSYRLYSLEELAAAWESANAFIHPENRNSVFSKDEIDGLSVLLDAEYHTSLTEKLKETIEKVTNTSWISERFANKLLICDSFPKNDKATFRLWLEWIFTCALMMRGWEGAHRDYPVMAKDCRIEPDNEKKILQSECCIHFCAGKIKEAWEQMNTKMQRLLRDLPIVNYSPKNADSEDKNSGRERVRERAGSHKRGENREGASQENKDEKTGGGDALFGLWDQKCVVSIPIRSNEIENKEEQKEGLLTVRIKFPGMQIDLCDKFVRRVNDTVEGNYCYRTASTDILQSAAFYLNLFFNLEVPQCPVYCFEPIM